MTLAAHDKLWYPRSCPVGVHPSYSVLLHSSLTQTLYFVCAILLNLQAAASIPTENPSRSQRDVILHSRGHLATSADILGCDGQGKVLMESSRLRSGMLLNI